MVATEERRRLAHRHTMWGDMLELYLDLRAEMPFAWGRNDCGAFAIGAIHAMTGVEIRVVNWVDREGAEREIEREGGILAFLQRMAAEHDWRRRQGYKVHRGDVVAFTNPENLLCMGICGARGLLAPGPGGLIKSGFGRLVIAYGLPLRGEGVPDA